LLSGWLNDSAPSNIIICRYQATVNYCEFSDCIEENEKVDDELQNRKTLQRREYGAGFVFPIDEENPTCVQMSTPPFSFRLPAKRVASAGGGGGGLEPRTFLADVNLGLDETQEYPEYIISGDGGVVGVRRSRRRSVWEDYHQVGIYGGNVWNMRRPWLAFKLFCAARQNAVLRRSPFPPP
jgi:hypothetical protein